MSTTLEQDTLETIRREQMMTPGDRVAVAVSGGADSVALLRLLISLRETLGITLLVAHFDHALRGAESESDAKFAGDLARAHCLEFILGRADVAAAATQHRWNLEDAARRLRYDFFEGIVAQGRAARVAVGHTADDQAETVLARLFRGTGTPGLAGIHPVMGSVMRPLIAVRRRDLRAYLEGLGQNWREDATNRDLSRQRAHIRQELLPLLERDFSPSLVEHLGTLARLSREEQAFWRMLVEDRYQAFVRQSGGRMTISIPDLLAPLRLPSAAFTANGLVRGGPFAPAISQRPLTERLIRRLYESVHGDSRELMAVHVERVIHLACESSSGRHAELPGRVTVERNFGDLIFSRTCREHAQNLRETKAKRDAYQYAVNLPGEGMTTTIFIPELGSRVHLKVIDWPSPERDTKQEALDADLLRGPLLLRSWRAGDAYCPRGHRQSRKLKRMFVARHIQRAERLQWPVMECGGNVVWTRGMPVSVDFCASAATRTGVVIQEDHP